MAPWGPGVTDGNRAETFEQLRQVIAWEVEAQAGDSRVDPARGGPCDGNRVEIRDASELAPVVNAPTGSGAVARYRKTGDYEQLRGAHMTDVYSRTWLYDWIADE